jgi:hypothetical protein
MNNGNNVVLSKYHIPLVNPAADEYRRFAMNQEIPDLCSKTMRWALHLHPDELAGLERLNPDTLGRKDDEKLRAKYWAEFINSPESKPFRVQGRI